MSTQVTQAFDEWADSVAGHDEQKILAVMSPLMERLAQLHAEAKPHGNIQPKHLQVTNGGIIALDQFEAAVSQIMDRSSVYAPPEAHSYQDRVPTVEGDVYALAAVLYRAICGQSPMRAPNRKEPPQAKLYIPAKLGSAIADALLSGLALEPESRPDSVMKLRDLLKRPNATVAKGFTVDRASQLAMQPMATVHAATMPSKASLPALQEQFPAAPTAVKRLPMNLTVGRPVEIPVTDLFKNLGSWEIRFVNADELGLPFDSEKRALVGTPKLPGEHDLRLELSLPEASGRPPLERSIAVTVNPDPDSLWKNLDSNTKDRYYKPDTDHAYLPTPHSRIVAASQRGRSHAHEGLFRDDDFRLRFHETSAWHLLAAADGAGSAKFSRRGSQLACERAVSSMEQWLATQQSTLDAAVQAFTEKAEDRLLRTAAYSWLGGAAFEARKAIQLEAEKQDPPAAARDYATTLLLAVAKATPVGWVIATFSVGDGGIGLRRNNGEVRLLCSPDSGEFSGQTVFLTASNIMSKAEDIMQRVYTAREPDLSALVLMTDGVTDPKFPTESSLSSAPVWEAFWTELTTSVNFREDSSNPSEQLLKWLSFRSPGNHDDRTLVVLLPAAPIQQPPPATVAS